MRPSPNDELLALLAETNDLRRDVGRVLIALHRALVLWRDRGKPFATVVRSWAPGASLLLDRAEGRLRRLAPHRRDERLRRWVGPVLVGLAADLEAGDHRYLSALRGLEQRFLELTALMRDGTPDALHDVEAARDLRRAVVACGRTDRASAVAALRDAAHDLTAPAPSAPSA